MTESGTRRHILVVDDDPEMLSFVGSRLKANGYVVETAPDGQNGLDKALAIKPSVILLDLTMPGLDGIEVLVRLRQWYEGAIIIISADREEDKKVEALDLGADDYLTKPIGIRELMARVRSSLRRIDLVASNEGNEDEDTVINIGDAELNTANRTVSRNGEDIYLTRTEYELLRCLASSPGKVMTHRELLQEVWGPEYGDELDYLRTFIKQLRRKLEKNPSRPEHILTQPGVGFRLLV